jgi:hypothetical protein
VFTGFKATCMWTYGGTKEGEVTGVATLADGSTFDMSVDAGWYTTLMRRIEQGRNVTFCRECKYLLL